MPSHAPREAIPVLSFFLFFLLLPICSDSNLLLFYVVLSHLGFIKHSGGPCKLNA